MKRTITICATALIALTFTSESGAQNIVGRLADRAKNAAENAVGKKLENAVNNAVGKAMGNKNGAKDQLGQTQAQPKHSAPARDGMTYSVSYDTPANAADNSGECDGIKEFVDGLADIAYRKDVSYNNGLDAEEATLNIKVKGMEDVIKLLPAFPTADQIISMDAAFNRDVQKFYAASGEIANNYVMLTANVLQDPKYNSGRTSAAQRARMDTGAMQMFAAMQKYGIDPEKATDEEMEAFMKKAIANGEIQISSGEAQAFDMNYTDEMESDIDKITDKINALNDSAQGLVMENAFFTSRSPLRVTLDSLYNDAIARWKTSDAYNKVYDIEKDIDKRAWDYIENHADYNNINASIPYPPFWVQGRKQENAIIREYNINYINQWTGMLQSWLEKPVVLLKESSVLDDELEKVFPEKNDLIYANLKTQLGVSITNISNTIKMLLNLAYDAPVINSVEESKVLSM